MTSPTPGLAVAAPAGKRCAGGRFWALAEASTCDSDGKDGDSDGGLAGVASPTPSDAVCEALRVGYPEEEVAMMVDLAIPFDDPARRGLRSEDGIELVRRVVH